ncbi:hypothetical protein [Ktedonospora formicarum]|uniref:Nucleotidyltransferase n=1 Tax=Ktedonospora formicarum TaxID=2778364 RepID=A0A8J3HVK2_9CHLR|nr:hypothetical protein [Ktedonospora formicarum]GHO44852.1 hypothetical protein KSX_30150 [Ktedonospora formicarum]
MFDISPLDPLVQPIALEAAKVYYKHTYPWFIGLGIHGSAYKGGYIPGCSDIDLKLFLRDEALTPYGELPLEIGQAIQRDLACIDPTPFSYIQTMVLTPGPRGNRPTDWSLPIPGTYHMLAGNIPTREQTEAETLAKCHETLQRARRGIINVSGDLLHHGSGKLERATRFLCTDVWPTLYSYRSVQTGRPFTIWSLPKDQVISQLPEDDEIGRAIRDFHTHAIHYFTQKHTTEGALTVIASGVAFLQLVEQRYQTMTAQQH